MRRCLVVLAALGALAFGAEAAHAVPSIAIEDTTVPEGTSTTSTSTAMFTVTLSEAPTETITASYSTGNETTQAADYTQTSGQLVWEAGDGTSRMVQVPVTADSMDEFNERFRLAFTNVQGTVTNHADIGVATIIDDDDPPTVTVADAAVPQPVSDGADQFLTFTVSLSAPSGKPVHVRVATADPVEGDTPPDGYAAAEACDSPTACSHPSQGDYLPKTETVTYPANVSPPQYQFQVRAIGDSLDRNRWFKVVLTSVPHLESPSANFTPANANAPIEVDGQPNTIEKFVSAHGVALQSQTTTGPAVPFTFNGTSFTDGDVSLSTPSDATAIGKIPSRGPTASIAGTTVNEGAAGTTTTANVTVTLDSPAPQRLSVGYVSADGTGTGTSTSVPAKAPADYEAIPSGQRLVFEAGQTTRTIPVQVRGNDLNELDKKFSVTLTAPENARLATVPTAEITIKNDDPTPGIVAPDVTVAEPRTGTGTAVVNVSLNGRTARTLTASYDTRDGSAAAGTNYGRTTGTLTFSPGQTTKQIEIPVGGDGIVTEDLSFTLAIQNTADGGGEIPVTIVIADSDLTADNMPALSINDASVRDSGNEPGTAVFTVRMDRPLNRQVRVDYATADGSAMAPRDYSSVAGTLTFAAGETAKTISVPITGNSRPRFNETFSVVLSNPVSARIARGTGLGIIIDAEDAALPLSVSGRSVRASSVLCRRGRRCRGLLVRWTAPASGKVRIRITALMPQSSRRPGTRRARTRRLALVQKSYRVRAGSRRVRVRRPAGRTTSRLLRRLRAAKVRTAVVTVTFTDRFGAQRLSQVQLRLRP